MNKGKADIYTGIVDGLAVMLPGILVTWLYMPEIYSITPDSGLFSIPPDNLREWLIFIMAAYITGNVIYLVSLLFLDKLIYDKFLRNIFYAGRNRKTYLVATALRDRYMLPQNCISRLFITKGFEKISVNRMYDRSLEIKNTYKDIVAFALVEYPGALVVISRAKANSEFYGSMAVAFLMIGSLFLAKEMLVPGLVTWLLMLLFIYRFAILKYRATQKAYSLIINIEDHKLSR